MNVKDILIICSGLAFAVCMGILTCLNPPPENPVKTSFSEIDVYKDTPSMDSHSETSLFQITK